MSIKRFKSVERSRISLGGFTLIELLVVIAILAILAGAILTVLDPAKQRAKAAQSGAKSLAKQACDNLAVCNIEDSAGVCGSDDAANLDDDVVPGCSAGGTCSEGAGAGVGENGLTPGVGLESGWTVDGTITYFSDMSNGKYACSFTCEVDGNHAIAPAPIGTGECLID